jgi:hypothetical protein
MPSELAESERLEALKGFGTRRDWYRATELDQLSDEEARVIAARMIARLHGKISMTSDQANRLATAISVACARVLPGASTTSSTVRRHEIAAAILDAGRAVLGDVDFVTSQKPWRWDTGRSRTRRNARTTLLATPWREMCIAHGAPVAPTR